MIEDMSRVELVCMNSVRNDVVEVLQDQGLLHLEEVGLELEEAQNFLDRVQLEGEDYESFVALDGVDRTLNEVIPLLTLQPGELDTRAAMQEISGWDDATVAAKIGAWAESLRSVTRARAQLQDTVEILKNYKGILEQVAPVLGGAHVTLGKGTRAVVLTGDVKKVVERLDERLREEIGSDCAFHRNQTSRRHLVGLITFPEAKEDVVGRILGQEGITPVDMRDQGFDDATLGEVLERIDRTIDGHEADITKLLGDANKASRQVGRELLGARAVVTDRLARLRVQAQFAESAMVTVIHGWTPSDRFDALEKTVEARFPGRVEVNRVSIGDPHHAHVPTLLRNHEFFKPFEVVMSLFKPPSYGTIDPTWMVGLSFTIFYGFILGDAAYGLVIVLLALWIKGKWGTHEIGNAVGQIALYMGVSAIVFGVLYGEYFGNFVELWLWPKVFGSEFHLFLFHRAHETTQLLVLAIWFGLVLIPAGLVLGIREDFRHGHSKHAIEKAGMLLGLLAVILYVFNYFDYLIFGPAIFQGVAAVMFVSGSVLIFYAMGVMGLIGVLEIMSLGGNVLSYARLMALGVASIALADIANMLPGMMGYLIGIPMALFVHVLNIGIGIASPTIHSLRLNFVEFLPKFYSPEGSGFNPFRKEAQW